MPDTTIDYACVHISFVCIHANVIVFSKFVSMGASGGGGSREGGWVGVGTLVPLCG